MHEKVFTRTGAYGADDCTRGNNVRQYLNFGLRSYAIRC